MHLYIYNGPVFEFERLLIDRWTASTRAESEKKARSNLAYQFKMKYGRTPNSKIIIPGKLTIVEGGKEFNG